MQHGDHSRFEWRRIIGDARALPHTRAERVGTAEYLCADTSADLLAYLRGLLTEAGHRVLTVENLYDGLILLKTMGPRVVVIGWALHALGGPASAAEFHRRLPPDGVIVLADRVFGLAATPVLI